MAGAFQDDAFQSDAFQADAGGGTGGGGLVAVQEIDDCGCCESGAIILEPCVCESDCTIATRYLTITGTSDCDGTYPLTCEMIDIPGIGLVPQWRYEGEFGLDAFGFPCNQGEVDNAIWALTCAPATGFYGLAFDSPSLGTASAELIEQQCDPFYLKFALNFFGLTDCCDYTGTPIAVVTN